VLWSVDTPSIKPENVPEGRSDGPTPVGQETTGEQQVSVCRSTL
jgi:hypothetical protein